MASNQKVYLDYLEQARWDGNPECPYCGSHKATKVRSEDRHHCNSCHTSYSVTVGTFLHKTHIELQKWFLAIYEVQHGTSVRQLAQKICVSKNTASYMIKRIKEAIQEEPELMQKLVVTVELLKEEN